MIFKRAIAKLRAQDGTAITIELVIVTLGVLIALAAQQWANNRSQSNQMDVDMKAVRDELAVHYGYAVEYRVVYPCLRAQMDQLRDRVLSSGATLNPVRLYRDEDFSFVIREPDKLYSNDAWQAAIDDARRSGFRRGCAGSSPVTTVNSTKSRPSTRRTRMMPTMGISR